MSHESSSYNFVLNVTVLIICMHFQGNSASKVNPVYAKICEVLVPISEGHKQFQHGEYFLKHKLVKKPLYALCINIYTKFFHETLNGAG